MRTTDVYSAECLCGEHIESPTLTADCPRCHRRLLFGWGKEPLTAYLARCQAGDHFVTVTRELAPCERCGKRGCDDCLEVSPSMQYTFLCRRCKEERP